MKALKHGDLVRIPSWQGSLATIGSVEAYAKQYNNDPQEALERARKHGHNLAWANTNCSVLCAYEWHHERVKAEQAAAITLAEGELVEVEGRPYTIRFRPGNTKYGRDQDAIQLIPFTE